MPFWHCIPPNNIYSLISGHTSVIAFLMFSVSYLLPPAMKLGQGYIFTGVCDSVHGGGAGVCLSACWDTTPPLAADPSDKADPPAQCMLGVTVNKRAVCILLECNSCFIHKTKHINSLGIFYFQPRISI